MFGRYTVPFVVFAAEEGGGLDPNIWLKLEEFVIDLKEATPGLKAAWLYDQLSETSRAFTAQRDAPLEFPDSSVLMSQFLMLFEDKDIRPYLDWLVFI